MTCVVQFDLLEQGYQFWWLPLAGLPLSALGFVFAWIFSAFPFWRVNFLIFGVGWACFALIGSSYALYSYHHLSSLYREGNYRSVVGLAEHVSGYDSESGNVLGTSRVGDKEFSLSSGQLDAGYHGQQSRGNIIGNGSHVRIRYIGDSIIRLEKCE